jgi:multidrug efflux system membrane fusion protein
MAFDKESSAPPPRRRHGWLWALALLLVVAAAFWLSRTRLTTHADAPSGKKGGGRGGAFGPVPVAVAMSHQGDIPVYLNGLGNVTAFYTVTVHTRVDGQLMNVAFQEGQAVKEGDLLAQLDPRPYQVQLEQAEGQMAHDQALLKDAQLDLARYKTLLAQDAIPSQQLDTQVATVAQYEGQIKTDQANIDNAKLQLIYCRVTAPITGVIGLRLVDPGNIVHAADTNGMLVITQVQPIAVLFTIPEDNLPPVLRKLRAGATLPVQALNRDSSEKLDTGKLLTVDNQIDPTTGQARLKAVFENRNFNLFPNQFVNVRLLVDTEHNQVIVPAEAVQSGSPGKYVYVVKPDNTVDVRLVKPGITEGDETAISSGLKVNEAVVIDGADKLQPGSKVRMRNEGGAPQRNGGGGRQAGQGAGAQGGSPAA